MDNQPAPETHWYRNKKILIIAIAILLIVVALFAYLFLRTKNTQVVTSTNTKTATGSGQLSGPLTAGEKSKLMLLSILKPEKVTPTPKNASQSPPYSIPAEQSYSFNRAKLTYHPLSDVYIGSVDTAQTTADYLQRKKSLVDKLTGNGIDLCVLNITWIRPESMEKEELYGTDLITDGCTEQ